MVTKEANIGKYGSMQSFAGTSIKKRRYQKKVNCLNTRGVGSGGQKGQLSPLFFRGQEQNLQL